MEAGSLPTAGKLSGINGPYLFRRNDIEKFVTATQSAAS